MPITINIVCVGTDLYGDAEEVARRLNDCQSDFEFLLPPKSLRGRSAGARYEEYGQQDAVDLLLPYTKGPDALGGAGTIGIARGRLAGNVFGVVEMDAPPYRAFVTTSVFDRYTPSLRVYLSFFFIRYALRFACPALRQHAKPMGCVSDARANKRELIPILDAPRLCDECIQALQPLMPGTIKLESIDSLLNVIRQYNAATRVTAVILKGGGVKGAALAGAIAVLMDDKYARNYAPTTFVGTSAGAIVATFLAAGLDRDQLKVELDRDFGKLLDPLYRQPWNLLRGAGFHSGQPIEDWIENVLRRGLKFAGAPQDVVRFQDVKASGRRLVVYAANRFGTLPFDSSKDDTQQVARAVRFSMSIPFFFTTMAHSGDEVFDGGLLNNFPVEAFRRNPADADQEFVAVYLSDGDRPARPKPLMLMRILSILLARDDFMVVRQHNPSTIVVDVSPIGTVDFSLSTAAKRLLENRGRLAALEFVTREGWDEEKAVGPECEKLRALIDADLLTVRREKHRGRIVRWVVFGLALAGVAIWKWVF